MDEQPERSSAVEPQSRPDRGKGREPSSGSTGERDLDVEQAEGPDDGADERTEMTGVMNNLYLARSRIDAASALHTDEAEVAQAAALVAEALDGLDRLRRLNRAAAERRRTARQAPSETSATSPPEHAGARDQGP